MNETQSTPTHIPGIKKRKDGIYTIDAIRYLEGQRFHVYATGFTSEEEAALAMPSIIEKKKEEILASKQIHYDLATYMDAYLEYRLLHVRASTNGFTKSLYKNFLSQFADFDVAYVFQGCIIKQLYAMILTHDGGPSWKNRCFGAIRQMVDTAFRWKLITSDAQREAISILENIPENRGLKKEKLIWSRQEKLRFLCSIDNPDDKMMFLLFINLGARISEFLGLTWDCVDFQKGVILIKQQLIYQGVGRWVLTPLLKTRESYRSCYVPKDILRLLKLYQDRTAKEGFLWRSSVNEVEPLSKGSFRNKMKRYIKIAKVRNITPHAIRHGKATDLMRVCKNMEEVKAAARFLGHSATMMIDTYGHSSSIATQTVLKRLHQEEMQEIDMLGF